jgi:hypothetical protein
MLYNEIDLAKVVKSRKKFEALLVKHVNGGYFMENMRNEFLFPLDLQFFAENNNTNTTETEKTDNTDTEPKKTDNEPQKDEVKMIPYERFKQVNDDLRMFKKTFESLGIDSIDSLKALVADYQEKKKAEEERKRAEMTELERYKADLEKALNERQTFEQELEKLRESIKQERIKNAFITAATNANIAYIDDAYRLADLSAVTIDDDGNVVGIEDVIKALVEHKPFLLAQAKKEPKPIGESTNAKSDKSDKSAEQLLREAAEKARRTGRPEDLAAYAKLKRELGL